MSPTTWLLAISIIVATAAVLLILFIPRVGELFHQHVPDRPKRRLFLAAVGFFSTFTLARSLAYFGLPEHRPVSVPVHRRHACASLGLGDLPPAGCGVWLAD